MNSTETHAIEHAPVRETSFKWVAGGSMMEAIGAIATIALAIVGLAGIFPPTMTAIAAIVIGAALLLEGGSFGAAQYTSRTSRALEAGSSDYSAAFLGGIAGIVLGILALLGIASMSLLSVAVIVYGGAFLLTGVSQANTFANAAGGHTLVGLAAVVLGILAVVGLSPQVLTLVAFLCLGGGALFSGSTQGAKAVTETSRTV